jgi:two-component system CheB/CheR fusion protein
VLVLPGRPGATAVIENRARERSRSEHAGSASFEEILQHLHQTHGFDFTAYKRASLTRRVLKRMQTLNVPSFEAYLDRLGVDAHESEALVDTILIKATSFFRDREVWAAIGERQIPAILAQRGSDVIRIWSTGCAGGHEPYTMAMLLAERLGAGILRERVRIYATDVDEGALAAARAATYPLRQVAGVPPELVDKYFERTGSHYTITRNLRRAVSVGRHDVTQDAPIPGVDLLACRNTLMYFHTEAQARILARFHSSVSSGGYLLLGRAELLFRRAAPFSAVDLKHRIFRAVPGRAVAAAV